MDHVLKIVIIQGYVEKKYLIIGLKLMIYKFEKTMAWRH